LGRIDGAAGENDFPMSYSAFNAAFMFVRDVSRTLAVKRYALSDSVGLNKQIAP
jgi:hypothetical protein